MKSCNPFSVSISNDVLKDLRARIARTRWPDQIKDAGWDYGTNENYLKELVTYWGTDFDWRKQERYLNQFDHYRADVDGIRIHFVLAKSRNPDAIPLLALHGWPSSFVQMLDLIPLLTDPAAHGAAPDAPAFHVIAPSLPGYGFSAGSQARGMSERRMAALFERLMTENLGYAKFAARGSDVGGSVLRHMALNSPQRLTGLHLTGLRPYISQVPPNLTPAEERYVQNVRNWMDNERAYAMMHATKPQTVAHALNDSPAGLASWIIEKFRAWSDCDGNVETRFSKDDLLINLTIYWVTQTINSSMRLYYESLRDPGSGGRWDVPTAMLMAPRDLVPGPREWAERIGTVTRWTETDRGGHFLEWEEPQLVAEDLRAFFGSPQTSRNSDHLHWPRL